MSLKDKLIFSFIRRHQIAKRIHGFKASARSFASKKCEFEGFNHLSGNSHLTNVKLGLMSYISSARISNANLGRFCSIGFESIIGLGTHPARYLSTHPAFYSTAGQSGLSFVSVNSFPEYEPIEIGNDVWIGARAVILGGVSIGDGAIIAAGAVVVNDVPSFSIVGGIPAKIIRYRFTEDVCRELTQWKWWDMPIEKIHLLANEITSHTEWTVELIKQIKKKI